MSDHTISHYNQFASHYYAQYNSLEADVVHADWLSLLKNFVPGLALDIGAGSGRDAAWLATQGWKVTAVEPAAGLRQLGQVRTSHNIEWIDSSLPNLKELKNDKRLYNLILLSAVWMHIPSAERPLALQRICEFLSPDVIIIFTLRFGPSDQKRPMYPVSIEELKHLSQKQGLKLEELHQGFADDRLKRDEVRWKTICLNSVRDSTI